MEDETGGTNPANQGFSETRAGLLSHNALLGLNVLEASTVCVVGRVAALLASAH